MLELFCFNSGRLVVTQPEVEKKTTATTVQMEWRQPVLRKLPIAATAHKVSGNEGQGQGKGDNIGFIS